MNQLVILQVVAGIIGPYQTIILLLFFVGFAVLNGKIAKWKGYPFWAGAISGIFLSFLGTILFLVMPFNQKKTLIDYGYIKSIN